MKRSNDRRASGAPHAPREIKVRMPAPRPVSVAAPDVWVVNGRVIRFLDPSRPEETAAPRRRPGVLAGLVSGLRPRFGRRRLTVG
jgi:hypothetical protein